jgi:putative aldouronate transport system substrate-binding protein
MRKGEGFWTIGMLALTLLAIAGCGKGGMAKGEESVTAKNVNLPGEFPICKEPITIQVGIRQDTTVEDYATNSLTKWFEEKGNFKLNFDLFSANVTEARQKVEIMVAAGGDLPEVLVGFSFSEETILNMGLEGAAIPLNDYYQNWAYYIKDVLTKVDNKDTLEWLTSADGNIYYIPRIEEQIANKYAMRAFINQTWLDKLGLAMPTTTDEFEKVLEAFVSRDPNGNGIKDEVGIIGGNSTVWHGEAEEWLMNAFVYDDTAYNTGNRFIVNEAGKIEPVYTKAEWREGLRYINRLVKKGLFLPQSFTMDTTQLRQLIESGESSRVGVYCSGGSQFSANNPRKLEYVALPPLIGPQGVCYTPYFPAVPERNFVITKSAKNPEAIFRWGDLICSEEGYMWMRFGVAGEDWKKPEPGAKSLGESIGIKPAVLPILIWGAVQNKHWAHAVGIIPVGVTDGQVLDEDNLMLAARWNYAALPYYIGKEAKNRVDLLRSTQEEAEEIRDLRNTINSYVKESLALFAVGDKDIERDWDSYLRDLDTMDLKRYLEISQSGYDRAIGK